MIVFTEQEAKENGLQFKKSCFICNRIYYTGSRNAKYCCDECREKSLVKINKRNKTRRRRRKEYDANREINRLLSKSYALAHEIAGFYNIPRECGCKSILGEKRECRGELQLHHKDLDPFNNFPDNLIWLSASCHKAIHDKMGDVNMVTVNVEADDFVGFEEESVKWRKKIDYIREKITIAGNFNK